MVEFACLVQALRNAYTRYFFSQSETDLAALRLIEKNIDRRIAEILQDKNAMESLSLSAMPENSTPSPLPVKNFTPPAGRKYLFTEDLVRITGIPKTAWQKWRSLKIGPAYVKVGRRAAYLPEDVQKWEDKQHVLTS